MKSMRRETDDDEMTTDAVVVVDVVVAAGVVVADVDAVLVLAHVDATTLQSSLRRLS